MEINILAALGEAFGLLFQLHMLPYIIFGVAIGTMLAVIPGVGALMGMALLLPSAGAHWAMGAGAPFSRRSMPTRSLLSRFARLPRPLSTTPATGPIRLASCRRLPQCSLGLPHLGQ